MGQTPIWRFLRHQQRFLDPSAARALTLALLMSFYAINRNNRIASLRTLSKRKTGITPH
jgi:hypothetical protein